MSQGALAQQAETWLYMYPYTPRGGGDLELSGGTDEAAVEVSVRIVHG